MKAALSWIKVWWHLQKAQWAFGDYLIHRWLLWALKSQFGGWLLCGMVAVVMLAGVLMLLAVGFGVLGLIMFWPFGMFHFWMVGYGSGWPTALVVIFNLVWIGILVEQCSSSAPPKKS